MWLWQLSLQQWLSNQPKQQLFFYKIVIAASIAHCFLFFSFFFLFRDSLTACAFTLSKSVQQAGAHIIVAPWKKEQLPQQTNKSAMLSKKAAAEDDHTSAKKNIAERPAHTKKLAVSTIISSPKKSTKKNSLSKQELRRKKLLADREQRLKQREEQKIARELNKKLLAQKKEEARQMQLAMQANNQLATAIDTTKVHVTDSQAIYVTPNEFDALQILSELQEELQKAWQPPTGLSSDLICIVTLIVDWQGLVHNAKIKEPSGVPVYDLSTLEALQTMKFPKSAFGKELTITFKQ